jgi:hypothetical protein
MLNRAACRKTGHATIPTVVAQCWPQTRTIKGVEYEFGRGPLSDRRDVADGSMATFAHFCDVRFYSVGRQLSDTPKPTLCAQQQRFRPARNGRPKAQAS